MTQPPPDVQKILDQIAEAVTAIVLAGDSGTLTLHIGPTQAFVEVFRKADPIKLDSRPKTPQRGSWEGRK